jgi:GH24 family phage-related lysozyme (muramidase)
MKTGPNGQALIKSFEGFARVRQDGMVAAYPDPVSGGAPWTIGWGSTGADIRNDTVWTKDQCQQRFDAHLANFEDDVNEMLGNHPVNQNQFDAMVSFAYNLGASALKGSTLFRKHCAGDYMGAKAEFVKWNRAGGHVVDGLTRRRRAEADLYWRP